MKKNIKIIALFTFIFILSVLINIIPSNSKVSSKTMSVYSMLEKNKFPEEIDSILRANKISSYYADKDESNLDIKLKYSFEISEEEKKNYDIYNIKKEEMYAVSSGEGTKDLSIDDVKQALVTHKQIDDNMIIFSPNTFKWFVNNYNISNSTAYTYNSIEEIVKDDKTITGIVFDSEVDNKDKYNTKLIGNTKKNTDNIDISFCLLIKKGTLNSKVEKNIADEIKKILIK